ncbi:MAG: hypothetical protein L6R42_007390 [Xanthoria sp. 1 TBL-2021]|nr:MAG: hypothetical protein L6R42_007390 [Xanthoria sp. 1 TBL-2021]
MRFSRTTLALLASFSSLTNAWGTVGHATVGAIGDHYLTAQAKTFVASLLGSGVTMSSVASWADDYRYTTPGRFSAPFHYIDAEDSPPSTCSVDLNRDCGGAGGCIVSAIANYTQRVNDRRYTLTNRKQALESSSTSSAISPNPCTPRPKQSAATRSRQMVEKDAGGYGAAVITSFSNRLIAAIDSGAYATQKASWVSCTDVGTASACALSWARDANGINCAYVLEVDETDRELDGAYYLGAKPYIEMQIAKAGLRLGTYVNNLAAA